MQEISVCGVDFDQAKTSIKRAASGRLEGSDDAVKPRFIERHGRGIAFGKRDRAGGDHRPASFGRRFEPRATFPRQVAASLAPGVGKLNAGDGVLGVNEPGNPRQRLDMAVVPDSHVSRCDSPLRRNRRRFDNDEPHAACCAAAKVNQMPVVGHALGRAVLAHRRHDDPIAKRDAADLERAQKIDVGHLAVVLALRWTTMVGFWLRMMAGHVGFGHDVCLR